MSKYTDALNAIRSLVCDRCEGFGDLPGEGHATDTRFNTRTNLGQCPKCKGSGVRLDGPRIFSPILNLVTYVICGGEYHLDYPPELKEGN